MTFLRFQLLPKIMKYKNRVTTALFIEQSFEGVDFLFLIYYYFFKGFTYTLECPVDIIFSSEMVYFSLA